MTLTETEDTQAKLLRAYYPYRLVYVARNPVTGESVVSAVNSKRIPNGLARQGWQVAIVEGGAV